MSQEVSDCGQKTSIWRTWMGDSGACQSLYKPSDTDPNLWTCKNGDISLDLSHADPDAKKCMSWSTEGSCTFPMNKLSKLQVDLESNKCEGLWVAPLWISPAKWTWPQHETGEIDIFERGCSKNDGYLISFGENQSEILSDAWKQQGEGTKTDATKLRAFIEFSPGFYDPSKTADVKDEINIYKCPMSANPIQNGITEGCVHVKYSGYYKDTSRQTSGGTELMKLVSDVWNVPNLGCTREPQKYPLPQKSDCKFTISGLKLQFEDGKNHFDHPEIHPECNAILYPSPQS